MIDERVLISLFFTRASNLKADFMDICPIQKKEIGLDIDIRDQTFFRNCTLWPSRKF